jgi:hypothetical protein
LHATRLQPSKKEQKRKKNTFEKPEYNDDESSLNDGVDYTNEDNYALKKFIGHREIQKKRKGNSANHYMEGLEGKEFHYFRAIGKYDTRLANRGEELL